MVSELQSCDISLVVVILGEKVAIIDKFQLKVRIKKIKILHMSIFYI